VAGALAISLFCGGVASAEDDSPTQLRQFIDRQVGFTTARIIPSFGGVLATRQTGSCGSCHLGEVAGKSATLINLNVGGEGRSYTDASGNLIPRRRPRSPLTLLAGGPVDGAGSLGYIGIRRALNARTLNLFPSFIFHSKTSSVVIAIAAFRLL
jgi:hypothetical protein